MIVLAAAPLFGQIRITGLEGLETKAKSSVDVTLGPEMIKLATEFLAR